MKFVIEVRGSMLDSRGEEIPTTTEVEIERNRGDKKLRLKIGYVEIALDAADEEDFRRALEILK